VYGLAGGRLTRPVALEPAQELLVTRCLRGFGPVSAKGVSRYAGWTIGEARAVLQRMTLRRFRDPDGGELLDLPRAPSRRRTPRRPSGSCPPSTPRSCSGTPPAPGSCRRNTGRRSSTPACRSPYRPSWSTAGWPHLAVHGRPGRARAVRGPPGPVRREIDEKAERLTAFYDT
jgi:hypothetical protein